MTPTIAVLNSALSATVALLLNRSTYSLLTHEFQDEDYERFLPCPSQFRCGQKSLQRNEFTYRSEERRVGKECKSRRSRDARKKRIEGRKKNKQIQIKIHEN